MGKADKAVVTASVHFLHANTLCKQRLHNSILRLGAIHWLCHGRCILAAFIREQRLLMGGNTDAMHNILTKAIASNTGLQH